MTGSRIVVLGATGMLGSAVYRYVHERGFQVCGTHRGVRRIPYESELVAYDPLTDARVGAFVGRGDYVVNCIGVIKPYVETDKSATIFINSCLPHELAVECRQIGARLIHITTDCVFSGEAGRYDEHAPHDAADLYGRSKSLGEPRECLALRTSIIGREVHSGVSLVEWFLKQQGKEVNGFVNHWWNGVTTREYARGVERIVADDLYVEGTRHIFSDTLTKHEMLVKFKELFRYDSTVIHPVSAPERIDRTLRTAYDDFLPRLGIRRFEEMMNDLLISSAGDLATTHLR